MLVFKEAFSKSDIVLECIYGYFATGNNNFKYMNTYTKNQFDELIQNCNSLRVHFNKYHKYKINYFNC